MAAAGVLVPDPDELFFDDDLNTTPSRDPRQTTSAFDSMSKTVEYESPSEEDEPSVEDPALSVKRKAASPMKVEQPDSPAIKKVKQESSSEENSSSSSDDDSNKSEAEKEAKKQKQKQKKPAAPKKPAKPKAPAEPKQSKAQKSAAATASKIRHKFSKPTNSNKFGCRVAFRHSFLHSLAGMIKEISVKCRYITHADGIEWYTMDPSHVCVFTGRITEKDTYDYAYYGEHTFDIPSASLFDLLAAIKGDDQIVEIEMVSACDYFAVYFYEGAEQYNAGVSHTDDRIPLDDIQMEMLAVPDLPFQVEVEFTTVLFRKVVAQFIALKISVAAIAYFHHDKVSKVYTDLNGLSITPRTWKAYMQYLKNAGNGSVSSFEPIKRANRTAQEARGKDPDDEDGDDDDDDDVSSVSALRFCIISGVECAGAYESRMSQSFLDETLLSEIPTLKDHAHTVKVPRISPASNCARECKVSMRYLDFASRHTKAFSDNVKLFLAPSGIPLKIEYETPNGSVATYYIAKTADREEDNDDDPEVERRKHEALQAEKKAKRRLAEEEKAEKEAAAAHFDPLDPNLPV
jgi:hypothetical protein